MRRALLALLLIQPSCPAEECLSADANLPSTAIECPAGDLCYQGRCIQSCTAGQEGAQMCTSDGDCDSTRPNCNDGFCSACEEGDVCIPTLNICRILSEPGEPPPPAPGGPVSPLPLDGGWIDGGIRVGEDAGIPMPIDRTVTHAGLIDLAQVEGNGPDRSVVSVEILHVGDVMDPGLVWFIDPPSLPATATTVERTGGCQLSQLQTYSASIAFAPANIGDISIVDGEEAPGSITTTIAVRWSGTDYVVPTGVPAELLRYSKDRAASFVRIRGPGSAITDGGWPTNELSNGEHVPFELVPLADTAALLAGGIAVSIEADGSIADDLTLAWSTVPFVTDEHVTLRVRSPDHALLCLAAEEFGQPESRMVVPRTILASFAMRAGLGETTLPLYFERSYTRVVNVVPANDRIDISVAIRIRHTIESTIRFDQR